VIYHRFRREKKSYAPVNHPLSTSYPSQFPQAGHNANRSVDYATPFAPSDIEASSIPGQPVYEGRARSVSFNHERDTRYETYRQKSFTPEAPAVEAFERNDVPQVYVEHHDAYELDSRREMR
jgi:hypothetical protein